MYRAGYIAPCFDIPRGISVGVRIEATLYTKETGLALSIGFLAMPAGGAGSARVSRIDKHERQTHVGGFVGDKLSQLEESPIAHQPTHRSGVTVRSFSDARKVFESECLPCFQCGCNEFLGDNMVRGANEPRLLASDLQKTTFRAFLAAFRLLVATF